MSLPRFVTITRLLRYCCTWASCFRQFINWRSEEFLSIDVQAHHLLMSFEEPLKDYVRAVQSIKVVNWLIYTIRCTWYFFRMVWHWTVRWILWIIFLSSTYSGIECEVILSRFSFVWDFFWLKLLQANFRLLLNRLL